MNEFEVKELLSKILNNMQDQCEALILRNILFNKENIINWNTARKIIFENMPELKYKYNNKY